MWRKIPRSIIETVNSIALLPDDSGDIRSAKNLLVWLAVLMSTGGMVWGTLLASLHLTRMAMIPFGYVVLSVVNVRFLQLTNKYHLSANFQVFISLLLPYMLQWGMGGFFSSGIVMLWSSLALIGAILLLKGQRVYVWLFFYILLAYVSFAIDSNLAVPKILTTRISLTLTLINIAMITSIVFVLIKVKTDRDSHVKGQLSTANMQLTAAKELAEESDRLKSAFLGNLSHEVRTPLQAIQGMTDLLEMPSTKIEDQKKYIGIIKRRTSDLQNIIEALLDLASLENSEVKAFPIKIDLHEAIESAHRENLIIHSAEIEKKAIKFYLQNELEAHETAFVDAKHFTQVLINLIGNAFKFTQQGSVTLAAKRQNNHYLIEVIDTGMGIQADKIDHIFKPFRQAHEGLSRSKGGIGLGLSICKKMIELWGGDIQVQSSPGVGSVFSFTIPA